MDAEMQKVLEAVGDLIEEQGWPSVVDLTELPKKAALDETTLADRLKALEGLGYWDLGCVFCGAVVPSSATPLTMGIDWVMDRVPGRRAELLNAVIDVTRSEDHSSSMARVTGIPEGLVKYVLQRLEDQGLVRLSRDTCGWSIYERSPRL